jgi:hypothetical protein
MYNNTGYKPLSQPGTYCFVPGKLMGNAALAKIQQFKEQLSTTHNQTLIAQGPMIIQKAMSFIFTPSQIAAVTTDELMRNATIAPSN